MSPTNTPSCKNRRTCCTPGVEIFADRLAQLDAVLPHAAALPDGAELLHASEGGLVEGGRRLGSDAPDGDGRALVLQALDEPLVEVKVSPRWPRR